jgi:hypothetical protein
MAGIGIAKKGLGILGKKRKTLTISGRSPSKKRTVIIKKPSTTKLAHTWQDRRIQAMNRKIKKRPGIWDDYVQEASDIYGSKALTKKGYKANQKKFYSLPEEQQRKIWKIKSRRELQGKK